MEVTIRAFGNSYGIILKKSVMKKYSLKADDVLVLDENSPEICLRKKNAGFEASHFFDALPISPMAYGGNTTKYLEQLEEPDDE